jgi:O-antigen/teichoic acid export membrane protein
VNPDRISRNAGFAFAAQMVGAALTAVLTIFLGRALSPDDYGHFAFAVSIATLVTLAADLGVSASAGRFIAEHRSDRAAVRDIFSTALQLKLALSVGTALALFVLAPAICSAFGNQGATGPVRIVAVSLVGQSTFLLLFGALDAIGQIRYRLLIASSESLLEASSSIAFVVLGGGAAGAAFGRAFGYTVGLALGLAVAARVLGPLWRRRGTPTVVSRRRILTYAAPLLAVDTAFRVFASVDVLLVAAFLGGGAQVAAFELPMRLAAFLDYPAAAAASAVAPRLARHGDGGPDVGLFSTTLRYLVILQVLLLPPLLVWPEAIFHVLFGDKFPEAPAVLRALVPYVFLAGVAQLATLGVNYLGAAASRVPIAVAMLTVNVAVDVILLPRVGVVAGGIGTSAAYAVWVPAHLWILHRRVGLPLRPLLLTVGRTLLAAGAACAMLAALGTGEVALWRMAVGAVLLPVVYLGILVAVRELRPADLAIVRGIVGRRGAAA